MFGAGTLRVRRLPRTDFWLAEVHLQRLIPIVVVGALVAGCSGGLVRPRIEKGIKNALPEYVGPATEYTVRADGSTRDMLNGFIELLHIEGRDVQIDPNVALKHMWVEMGEVRYNRHRELTSVGETTFGATVLERVVNQYIEQARDGSSDLRVKFETAKVSVVFVPKVVGVDVAVVITGKPVIVGGDKVNFVADRGSVARVPVPAYIVNKALDRVNPILDMSLMKFPVSLKHIAIRDGAVVVKGSAQFKPTPVEE